MDIKIYVENKILFLGLNLIFIKAATIEIFSLRLIKKKEAISIHYYLVTIFLDPREKSNFERIVYHIISIYESFDSLLLLQYIFA